MVNQVRVALLNTTQVWVKPTTFSLNSATIGIGETFVVFWVILERVKEGIEES